MTYLALNLLLAIVWMFLAGNFSIGSLLFGFAIGFLVLVAARAFLGCTGYVRATFGLLRFLRVYFWEIVRANVQLARDLLRPEMPFKPGFLRVHVPGLSRTETVVLSNMISLTPGTLTVDWGEGEVLYIHTIYAHDPAQVRTGVDLFADLIDGVTGYQPPPAGEERDPWK